MNALLLNFSFIIFITLKMLPSFLIVKISIIAVQYGSRVIFPFIKTLMSIKKMLFATYRRSKSSGQIRQEKIGNNLLQYAWIYSSL